MFIVAQDSVKFYNEPHTILEVIPQLENSIRILPNMVITSIWTVYLLLHRSRASFLACVNKQKLQTDKKKKTQNICWKAI